MKKVRWQVLSWTTGLSLLPVLLGISFYSKLPATIAVHFSMNNQPNTYVTKPVFVFGFPIAMAIFQALMCIINDTRTKDTVDPSLTAVFKSIVPFLSNLLYTVTILFALGHLVNIRSVAMIALGLISLLVGGFSWNRRLVSEKASAANAIAIKRANHLVALTLIVSGLLMLGSVFLPASYSVAAIGVFIVLVLLSSWQLTRVRNRE